MDHPPPAVLQRDAGLVLGGRQQSFDVSDHHPPNPGLGGSDVSRLTACRQHSTTFFSNIIVVSIRQRNMSSFSRSFKSPSYLSPCRRPPMPGRTFSNSSDRSITSDDGADRAASGQSTPTQAYQTRRYGPPAHQPGAAAAGSSTDLAPAGRGECSYYFHSIIDSFFSSCSANFASTGAPPYIVPTSIPTGRRHSSALSSEAHAIAPLPPWNNRACVGPRFRGFLRLFGPKTARLVGRLAKPTITSFRSLLWPRLSPHFQCGYRGVQHESPWTAWRLSLVFPTYHRSRCPLFELYYLSATRSNFPLLHPTFPILTSWTITIDRVPGSVY